MAVVLHKTGYKAYGTAKFFLSQPDKRDRLRGANLVSISANVSGLGYTRPEGYIIIKLFTMIN